MRIHSDILTESHLFSGLPTGVELAVCESHGSRSRAYAWEVQLRGHGARHTRRPNSGIYGADDGYAATYDDWGRWLAHLFAIDPDAKMAYYDGADDFHRQTKNAYHATQEV